MLRRSFRIGLTLGLLGGLAFALVKMFGSRADPPTVRPPVPSEPWPRLAPEPTAAPAAAVPASEEPAPDPPAAKAATKQTTAAKKTTATKKQASAKKATAWVEPAGDVCPTSHPVKAKLSSKIFHLPGMLNYDRTKPDRCYRDGPAAEGDGLRPAKR